MNILYVHGFRSASTGSSKVEHIKSVYSEANVIAPDLSHDFSKDLVELCKIVENEKVDLVIGTSMGGLIADFLSVRYSVDAVLVNPLVEFKHLADKTGKYWVNYKTNKEFEFPEENKSYLNMMAKLTEVFTSRDAKTTVLLGSNDDVLDHKKAIEKYKDYTILIEDDDHRFNKYFKSSLETINK